MVLKVYTDGGAKGNPGPASIGIVFYTDGKKIFSHREDIGIKTNNEAEYMAVIKALENIKHPTFNLPRRQAGVQHPTFNVESLTSIEFYSDSSLLVNQVNGLFKVKNAKLREFIFKIRMLEQEIGLPISYNHIPREKNQAADDLVNG